MAFYSPFPSDDASGCVYTLYTIHSHYTYRSVDTPEAETDDTCDDPSDENPFELVTAEHDSSDEMETDQPLPESKTTKLQSDLALKVTEIEPDSTEKASEPKTTEKTDETDTTDKVVDLDDVDTLDESDTVNKPADPETSLSSVSTEKSDESPTAVPDPTKNLTDQKDISESPAQDKLEASELISEKSIPLEPKSTKPENDEKLTKSTVPQNAPGTGDKSPVEKCDNKKPVTDGKSSDSDKNNTKPAKPASDIVDRLPLSKNG